MKLLTLGLSSTALLFAIACSDAQDIAKNGAVSVPAILTTASAQAKAPNFIVLIGDDMSVETLSCFGVGDNAAVTPNLDRLCASGMRFDNFWAQPVCSPTRATILSGKYGFRNGVGTPAVSRIAAMPAPEMPTRASKQTSEGSPRPPAGLTAPAPGLRADEFTLPQALKASDTVYDTLAFGKWHLADPNNGGKDHPNLAGFDHYHGPVRGGGVASYFNWSEVVNGEITDGDSGWADTAKVDDALEYLRARESDNPYLLWMAFNAPHTPFHLPPVELLNSEAKNLDPQGITVDNQHDYYYAMIEALDTEIGRLLANIPEQDMDNTYVIFVGDNGTPEQVATAPFDFYHAKGSMTQGGLSVPFIIAGPGVVSGQTDALANSVDIYGTLVDLAGINLSQIAPSGNIQDTVSLAPVLTRTQESVRDFAYADVFGVVPKGIVSERAIRNASHKLIVETDGLEKLFRIEDDPFESHDLIEAGALSDADQAALTALKTKLASLTVE